MTTNTDFTGYKVDQYHVQETIDGFKVICFQGSNVVLEVEAVSEAQGNHYGQIALAKGTDGLIDELPEDNE